MTVHFTVPGPAVGKARPRVVRRWRATVAYTPQKTKDYECRVREAAAKACRRPLTGPLRVIINIGISPPKSWSRAKAANAAAGCEWAARKPDLDNVAKAILDALCGVCYRDDSQVVNLEVTRRWWSEDVTTVWVEEVG